MKPATAERWAWILLYGGLLVLCLGVFVRRDDAGFGAALIIGGAIAAAAGIGLIAVRARMSP
jgi:hypothetical protein